MGFGSVEEFANLLTCNFLLESYYSRSVNLLFDIYIYTKIETIYSLKVVRLMNQGFLVFLWGQRDSNVSKFPKVFSRSSFIFPFPRDFTFIFDFFSVSKIFTRKSSTLI